VKALPRGATPIDFAYSIHTDIGHQCVGARVNGKMVPLRYRLKNGDIVEILIAAGHRPSRDWLTIVVTSRARSKVRSYLTPAKQRSMKSAVECWKKRAARLNSKVIDGDLPKIVMTMVLQADRPAR
jgi:GTP pyrophosphokinase